MSNRMERFKKNNVKVETFKIGFWGRVKMALAMIRDGLVIIFDKNAEFFDF